MTLLHENDMHFNLVVAKNSNLATMGSLSFRFNIATIEDNMLKEEKNGKESEETSENISLQKKIKEYEKIIQSMKVEIEILRCENKDFKENIIVEIEDNSDEDQKKCVKCGFQSLQQYKQKEHLKIKHGKPENSFSCTKECKEEKEFMRKEYFACEKELKNKTEENEKHKIEIKDLKKLAILRQEVKEVEKVNIEDEASLFTMKNQGYQRKDPQSESIPKNHSNSFEKVKNKYCCENCNYQGYGEVHLRNHMKLIHGMERPYKCEKCAEEFEMKSYLSNHMNLKHKQKEQCEEEYNCMECPFQGNSRFQLEKHINLKHTQKVDIPMMPGSLQCRICHEIFENKSTLMIHRKLNHKNFVAKCRKFQDRICDFTSESCWWNHEDKMNSPERIHCYVCMKTFDTKKEMMGHRKKYHVNLVKQCTNFLEGKCRFQNEFCWFIHMKTTTKDDSKAEEAMETENDSDFQKEIEQTKPPSPASKANLATKK